MVVMGMVHWRKDSFLKQCHAGTQPTHPTFGVTKFLEREEKLRNHWTFLKMGNFSPVQDFCYCVCTSSVCRLVAALLMFLEIEILNTALKFGQVIFMSRYLVEENFDNLLSQRVQASAMSITKTNKIPNFLFAIFCSLLVCLFHILYIKYKFDFHYSLLLVHNLKIALLWSCMNV